MYQIYYDDIWRKIDEMLNMTKLLQIYFHQINEHHKALNIYCVKLTEMSYITCDRVTLCCERTPITIFIYFDKKKSF